MFSTRVSFALFLIMSVVFACYSVVLMFLIFDTYTLNHSLSAKVQASPPIASSVEAGDVMYYGIMIVLVLCAAICVVESFHHVKNHRKVVSEAYVLEPIGIARKAEGRGF